MENFEQYLMDTYPDFFNKNEKGEPYCPCGVWAPEGWHAVIDELCGAMHRYIKCTSTRELKITSKLYYFWHFLSTAVSALHLFIVLKLCKKLNTSKFNSTWFKSVKYFDSKARKYSKYVPKPPLNVKIDQIKEKFGDLRFYISGGDRQIEGMISFAEYLCRRTCEVSGEKGELHIRGSWFKTLSPEIAKTDSYAGYRPVKN